ncbi:MAG: hypothetical protein ACP5EP_12530 [Acidobacteriaceae bacterium]
MFFLFITFLRLPGYSSIVQRPGNGESIFAKRKLRTTALVLAAFAFLVLLPAQSRAQAALLMEEPYGFFGVINPTGHSAVYFEHICAETPVKLRRCAPGEPGAVVGRYQGISGYDWVAIPLLAHLYAVDNAGQVPTRASRNTVARMLRQYYKTRLQASLGDKLTAGGMFDGGWNDLLGQAYMRRIDVFRFDTSRKQDDAFIARMNDGPNRSRFNPLYRNCADFARDVLNFYFPHAFKRRIFPDAGITTPRQTAYQLERYARKHPETHLAVFEIPQIAGNRHPSRSNKSVAYSLFAAGYGFAVAAANPYLAGGIFADYLARGRYPLAAGPPQLLAPDSLSALTAPACCRQNPAGNGARAAVTAESGVRGMREDAADRGELKIETAPDQQTRELGPAAHLSAGANVHQCP